MSPKDYTRFKVKNSKLRYDFSVVLENEIYTKYFLIDVSWNFDIALVMDF